MKVVAVLCVLYKCGLTSAPHLPGCPIECLVVVAVVWPRSGLISQI